MLFTLLILIAAAFGLIFSYRAISMSRTMRLNELEEQRQRIQSKYEFLREQKQALTRELAKKENQLATLRNSQEGVRTISARDLDLKEAKDNPDDKVSRYLLQKGLISLEQNEKAISKMATLHMDFLGVCLTLGYIDLETAKKAHKVNQLSGKLTQ